MPGFSPLQHLRPKLMLRVLLVCDVTGTDAVGHSPFQPAPGNSVSVRSTTQHFPDFSNISPSLTCGQLPMRQVRL